MKFAEGTVVIILTTQAGTIVQEGKDLWVLLRNGDMWVGSERQVRLPQDQNDLDACPVDVERPEPKREICQRNQGD